ncbi:ligase-associated DNA damage response DEXH box helicase [Ancylobacter terrae]|uniref:ligase-associated DNA damage response DEXH box helicase n=1 Tax=Ancylobacter sp. sgz301288 TaxID=3342077 RepID=UPI00385A5C62
MTDPAELLPEIFRRWFADRGWAPRAHQLELLSLAKSGRSVLLIAPTGAGKTLAGFLPTLVELSGGGERKGLHTLYISPLKALAVDVARNLERPAAEMGLPVRIETRTGDTPASRRQRQRRDPPDILLTTPEQIALLLASADAEHLFSNLKRIVLDELHALAGSKRGDLLALGLARLRKIAPGLQSVGLSATVADPDTLRRWLVPQVQGIDIKSEMVMAPPGAAPDLRILDSAARIPWAGHSARHAYDEIYRLIEAHTTTLVFVNTRMQAELVFQELWKINELNLPIALHHGSLDVSQRRRVEAAMGEGRLRGVVCTSSLDLGIDWGDVDLVINIGAPKGSSRLMQRIGRANHRLDEPSKAVLVPANRFEVLECVAALDAVRKSAQDGFVARSGSLDVLAQHIVGMSCAAPFQADDLYMEILSAEPYADLPRADFDDVLAFAATGGYALRAYERFARIRRMKDGRWRIANPMAAQQYRLNVGTIVESTMLKVRLASAKSRFGGRVLGEVEEYFVEMMSPGDTFVFAGEVLEYQSIVENEVRVSRSSATDPKVPSYAGGKFPLSTFLAAGVRSLLAEPTTWPGLPPQVREWLELQDWRSKLPGRENLLVETFPRGGRHYLVAYPFEGRLAHQTLGMLLTRRLERAGLHPLGFVANDYALAVYGLSDLSQAIARDRLSLGALFHPDMLGDDLEEWLAESALMKRTFRQCAVIAGLIERRFPGKEKNSRQVTMSTDLVYDVLRTHEPAHVLLRAARADAATGLLDIRRLGDMLVRVEGRISHVALDRVSPLAVPVMLEIGREPVFGEAQDALMAETEAELVREATGSD